MVILKDRDEPIYTISIAAKLVRPTHNRGTETSVTIKPIHAQTLRMYDRLGLVKPRKVGKNRFYSDSDIERLQRIQHFTQDIGINLAGVAYIFALMDRISENCQLPRDVMDAMLAQAEQQLREWEEKAKEEPDV